jgi:hypothetical protein
MYYVRECTLTYGNKHTLILLPGSEALTNFNSNTLLTEMKKKRKKEIMYISLYLYHFGIVYALRSLHSTGQSWP